MSNVLALIPARGGSKGLVRKNLRLLGGHPLVAWSVAAGRQARLVTRTLCSTDDPEIAEAARRYGAEVPFLRPAELAQDLTLDLPVFQHALEWLDTHERWVPDLVVQLRPTSPIRPAGLVDQSIELLLADPGASGVRAVCPAPCNPHKMWRLPGSPGAGVTYMTPLLDVPGIPEPYNAPRQALPPVWWQIGTVDTVRAPVIRAGSMSGSRLLPLRLDPDLAIDIDGEEGLRQAEAALARLPCVHPGPLPDWRRIRLLVLDVDGTLTPGTMYFDGEGEALKRFHTHDGKGIALVRERGVHVAIVTQESTPFAAARARKLKLEEVHLGVTDKVACVQAIAARLGLGFDQVACVGDDVGDVPLLQAVRTAGGIGCAVADARPEARAAAVFVTPNRGGTGAVRDVCDRLVAARS